MIDMDASKRRDNQRTRISGKCNLPTLSPRKELHFQRPCLNAYIDTGTPDSAIRAKRVPLAHEKKRSRESERKRDTEC